MVTILLLHVISFSSENLHIVILHLKSLQFYNFHYILLPMIPYFIYPENRQFKNIFVELFHIQYLHINFFFTENLHT